MRQANSQNRIGIDKYHEICNTFKNYRRRMIYKDYQRNHVILPGREDALESFLKQDYGALKQHKWKNAFNSNSEDALTWSCFDILANLTLGKKIIALNEILEDAYQGEQPFFFSSNQLEESNLQIHIGKKYTGSSTHESTEVDASIELPGKLIFIEAKLYSTVSLAEPPNKPHDQIARKLRIGLDSPLGDDREFFFIFLDIAPLDKLNRQEKKSTVLKSTNNGFYDKYKSAWLFNYYKHGRNKSKKPLEDVINDIDTPPTAAIADNMGWLTWSDLFKTVLRSVI